MGCGRRMRGRPSPSVVDRGLLHKRIRELEPLVDIYDVGAMVERLRELYWDYANKKLQPFTHCVQQALERCQHQRRRLQAKHGRDRGGGAEEDEVNEGASTLSSRRVKRLREEAAPLSPTRSTTPTSSMSSSSAESDDGDAVYEVKVKPEFDLVKSALRECYSKASQQQAGGSRGKAETDVQVENAMDTKLRRTAELVGSTAVVTPGPAAGEGFASVAGEGSHGPRFKDFGGIKALLEELMMEVVVPLYHPHLPRMLGVSPMAGILLHGPPGCGKTKLAHAIANETGVPFYKISATEVISGVSGASEESIRELFKKAYRSAPSIVFIDEIDAIGSKRENLQREMERRIVTQLMTCMDESHQAFGTADADMDTESSAKNPGYVLVIGATNRPDAVDPALRRPGRFDRELFLGVPDENARREILSVLTVKLKLDGALDLSKMARATAGFVGADLAALVNKAGNLAMRRIIDKRKSELSTGGCEDQDVEWWKRPWAPEEMEKLSISMFDFEEAVKIIQPSLRREGFSSIPNVRWEDVGGLDSLRKEFDRYVVQRVKSPEKYEEFGVTLEAGFLLYGPPGCGKTLIAKAVANEAGANFIHIKGPELLNKYVGESELAVRTIFSRARTCSPCILFFDEIDALTTRRGKDGESVVERLLLQLLIELDGGDQRRGVFVIGATNRPEAVDSAVLRPGRLGRVMYVPLPSADERILILKALARRKPLAADVDLDLIGRKAECENLSGADLAALVNEAAMAALEEKQRSIDEDIGPSVLKVIRTLHFEQALGKVSPSVSEKRRKYYDALSQNFRAA